MNTFKSQIRMYIVCLTKHVKINKHIYSNIRYAHDMNSTNIAFDKIVKNNKTYSVGIATGCCG